MKKWILMLLVCLLLPVAAGAEDPYALYAQGDTEAAFELFLRSAKLGDAAAQEAVGWCYESGEGAGLDAQQAFEWYQRAAEQGLATGQCRLGNCYYYGTGVTASPVLACYWYALAAAQDDAYAQYNLAYCYEMGVGVTRSEQTAQRLYLLAAAQGYAPAQKKVEQDAQGEDILPTETAAAETAVPAPEALPAA